MFAQIRNVINNPVFVFVLGIISPVTLAQYDSVPSFFTPPPQSLLLITYPVDVGPEKDHKKNLWMYALLDVTAHFRLDYCASFKTISSAALSRFNSPVVKGRETTLPDYSTAVRELHATHQLQQKFEIHNNERQIELVIEISDIKRKTAAVLIEVQFGFDFIGQTLDSCYIACLKGLAGNYLSPEEIRFTLKPALCVAFPNNKLIGELVYTNSYSGIVAPQPMGDQYRSLITLEPSPLLLSWLKSNACYQERNFTDALTGFRSISHLFPDNEACVLAVAKTCVQTNDPQTAKFQLTSVISSRPKPLPEVYRVLGDAYMISGDTAVALEYYLKERSLHGNNPQLQQKIANTTFILNQMNEAEIEYQALLHQTPTHPTARYYLAYIQLKLNKLKQAEASIHAAKEFGAGQAYLWEPIGDCYASRQNWKKAADAYEKAYHLDKKTERIMKKVHNALVKKGSDSLAAEFLVKHFESDQKKNVASLADAGRLFVKCKAWNKAAKSFETYLRAGYTDYEVTLAYARIMYAEKNWKKVIDLLEIHGASATATEEVLIMLAEARCESGEFQAASPVLVSLCGMNPGNPKILQLSALAAEKTRDFAKAAAMLERAIAVPNVKQPSDIAFHIGELYEKQKNITRSIERYETNAAQFPADVRNYERLVDLYQNGKQEERLGRILEKAIANVKVPSSWDLILARLYLRHGEHIHAAEMLQTYLAREPKDAEAWRDLGALYFSQNRCDRAREPLKKAAARLPRDFKCHSMLADCYLKENNYKSAIPHLERAYILERSEIATLERLALCYERLNLEDNRIATLKRWVAQDSKRSDIRIELGTLLLAKGRKKDALNVLFEAVRIDPSNQRARQLLAKAQQEDGASLHKPSRKKTGSALSPSRGSDAGT
jgi:predicted Zn-dependent protease